MVEQDFINKARRGALRYFDRVFQRFETSLGPERNNKAMALEQLRLLGQQISNSYH